MFSVSLLFPPYWDLALGFYFLLGIPWKNMGKIKWKIEWKIKSIFMLCICYYYSWRAIIPAISTIGNNVMCPPYINFRSMHHSRLYLEIGPIYNYRRNRRNRRNSQRKKKRKDELLDASSRGLLVEITMLRVNISFQFGLKSGGQILD